MMQEETLYQWGSPPCKRSQDGASVMSFPLLRQG